MRNLQILPEKEGKGNAKAPLLKRAGKYLTAAALAFSPQYGGILQAQPAAAAQASSQARQSIAMPDLPPVDEDFLLVDTDHTQKSGLAIMAGAPVLMIPGVDPDTQTRVLLMHRDGGIKGSKVPEMDAQLAEVMDCKGCVPSYPDTKQFLECLEIVLQQENLTDADKRRIHYVSAYLWAVMGHYERDGTTLSPSIAVSNERFKAAVAAFKILDDSSDWFQERLKDFSMFEATLHSDSLVAFTQSETALPRDVDTYSSEVGYLKTVQKAAHVMQERTAAYLAGNMPKAQFMLDQAYFTSLALSNLRYLTHLPKRGWMADQRFRDGMATVEAILPVLQQAHDAMGTGSELQTMLQKREKVLQATYLLGYQRILAENAYHFPGITSDELTTWANRDFETAQALIKAHSLATLHLPSDIGSSLQEERIGYAKAAGQYERLADASHTGEKVRALFLKVLAQKGKWAATDKLAWQQLLNTALVSSSPEAQNELLAVLHEGITVSRPTVAIHRYEDTHLTYNFVLDPIYREIEGHTIHTTEHPVDLIEADFSIDNRWPIGFPVTFVIELSGADNPRDVKTVYLEPSKVADVHYSGKVSLAQSRAGNGVTPRGNLQLTLHDVREVALAPMGEQLARAN